MKLSPAQKEERRAIRKQQSDEHDARCAALPQQVFRTRGGRWVELEEGSFSSISIGHDTPDTKDGFADRLDLPLPVTLALIHALVTRYNYAVAELNERAAEIPSLVEIARAGSHP